jgi:hypothetical protein
VTVEGDGPKLTYDLELSHVGTAAEIVGERLDVYQDAHAPEPLHALIRAGDKARIFDVVERKLVEKAISGRTVAVSAFGIAAPPAFQRLTDVLEHIELHVPFETRPVWQQRQLDIRTGPRWPSYVAGSQSLARYGLNLPNCFYAIRNLGDEVWDRIRDRVRLGLGADFRDLRLPSSQPGHIDLEVVFGSAPDKPLPLASLSEGQISYLAFVALVELNLGRSVLTFDEPEVHLHPAMLARVAGMLEEVAETCPVLLATHSDRLLDALATPEKEVVLCELDGEAATRLKRPNSERLAAWLESYRGFGSIRAEGYEAHVFDDEPAPIGSREREK